MASKVENGEHVAFHKFKSDVAVHRRLRREFGRKPPTKCRFTRCINCLVRPAACVKEKAPAEKQSLKLRRTQFVQHSFAVHANYNDHPDMPLCHSVCHTKQCTKFCGNP
jgi:hypothetical protein